MKKYLTPNIEINRFETENVVTGSAGIVDEWNDTNGYSAKTVDWKNDLKVIF